MNDRELYYKVEEIGLKKVVHYAEYSMLKQRTQYLSTKASIRNRMWHLLNGCDVPKCHNKHCNNNVNWSRKILSYAKYCSMKCRQSCEEYKKEKKNNFKNKYGVENPMHVDEFRNKCLQANMKNYNDVNKMNSINKKRSETNISRYGVHNIFCDTEKIKKSVFEKYGVENYKQKHMDMDLCSAENISYMNDQLKMTSVEIAKELNICKSTVCKILRDNDISIIRHPRSCGQMEIVKFLEGMGINLLVNDRNILDGLELDIVIPQNKIAIEYCGLYWHDHNHVQNTYHRNKQRLAYKKGYILLTIFEDEWTHKPDIIKKMLMHKLNQCDNKIGARKTKIVNVDKKKAKTFLDENHIQGATMFSFGYGLEYDGELISLLTITKRKNNLEITRYCTNNVVMGGFSKLLKYAIHENTMFEVMYTFADLRWGVGELYEKVGMNRVNEIPPDYYYVKGYHKYHKFNFRHSKLKKKFDNYDSSKTEFENCISNGFRRIYDCGKVKFSLDIKKALM